MYSLVKDEYKGYVVMLDGGMRWKGLEKVNRIFTKLTIILHGYGECGWPYVHADGIFVMRRMGRYATSYNGLCVYMLVFEW